MSTNLVNFNKALISASENIKGDMIRFYKAVCFETFKRIVNRTPVDTGRARGNWQMEVGKAASGTLNVEGSAGEVASKALNQATGKLSSITPFSIVHITNNVEYIYYLEYEKRSKQAPQGMVEITITEMANWLGNIR